MLIYSILGEVISLMAIIPPSVQFDNSELSQEQLGKILKPNVRTVSFNKNNNKEGTYLYILPAYKVDSQGRGVWYNLIAVRDNFGDKFKDRYVVWDRENDPVAYFEANIKEYYPDYAVVGKKMVSGREQKSYPFYGRVTKRVLYNVAYRADLSKGAHVLELPQANGASQLDLWQKTADPDGNRRPPLSDPNACIPVFFKLDSTSGESPWKISPAEGKAAKLPNALADSDNLYNLDEVYVKRTSEDLIDKLRGMCHPVVFQKCMAGYAGMSANVTITKPEYPAVAKLDDVPGPKIQETEKAPCVESLADIKVPKASIPAVTKETFDPAQAVRMLKGQQS